MSSMDHDKVVTLLPSGEVDTMPGILENRISEELLLTQYQHLTE